jgi:hypothetical protein
MFSTFHRTNPLCTVYRPPDLATSCKYCENVLFFPGTLTHERHDLPRGHRKRLLCTQYERMTRIVLPQPAAVRKNRQGLWMASRRHSMDDLDARLAGDICSRDGRTEIVSWRNAVSTISRDGCFSSCSVRSIMHWDFYQRRIPSTRISELTRKLLGCGEAGH